MDSLQGASFLISLVFIALIGLLIWQFIRERQAAAALEASAMRAISSIPSDKQMAYQMQLSSSKKDGTVAVLLALFLGSFGVHRFYLGQPIRGIVLLLAFTFFFWTFMPTLWAISETFMMPSEVKRIYHTKAIELAPMYGGHA